MRRSVVDYGLARRATFAPVLAGRTTVTDVCHAHPCLLRAARFHGEPPGSTASRPTSPARYAGQDALGDPWILGPQLL